MDLAWFRRTDPLGHGRHPHWFGAGVLLPHHLLCLLELPDDLEDSGPGHGAVEHLNDGDSTVTNSECT